MAHALLSPLLSLSTSQGKTKAQLLRQQYSDEKPDCLILRTAENGVDIWTSPDVRVLRPRLDCGHFFCCFLPRRVLSTLPVRTSRISASFVLVEPEIGHSRINGSSLRLLNISRHPNQLILLPWG